MKLNKEQIDFLNDCTEGSWTLNKKTGLVDIDGNFNCSSKKLKDLKGVRFGVVEGYFFCYKNSLTSLEGAPQVVKGYFCCSCNKLTSLEGAPQVVKGYFNCSHNSLTSLVGAPQVVECDFFCSNNSLTSLEGAPQVVKGNFNCSRNKLTSLEGAPQEVTGYFDCSGNKLTSLEGAPQEVKGDFDCSYNKLPIPKSISDLILKTMKDKGVNYQIALLLNKESIKEKINKHREQIEKLESAFTELDKHLSKDAQKGVSMLNRFKAFE